MNERIDKLLVKAGAYFGGEGVDYSNFDPKKFAELIVRECAKAFETEVDTWKQMNPYQGSIKRQGTKAIKQHFGVEE
jgi:hypothetical protein